MSYTWEVMVFTVAAYLISLPFGARKWRRKYGTLTIEEPGVGDDDIGRHI